MKSRVVLGSCFVYSCFANDTEAPYSTRFCRTDQDWKTIISNHSVGFVQSRNLARKIFKHGSNRCVLHPARSFLPNVVNFSEFGFCRM